MVVSSGEIGGPKVTLSLIIPVVALPACLARSGCGGDEIK